jgi:uncharacterized protein (TIGR02680 family)
VKHYQEMLDLLIQLRSPKLSKDFKPTTIYEILNNGLPPLQEDELRPLAEVLESIDQIGDRKKELETHTDFVKRLAEAYGRYNQYQLYQTAEKVVQADDKRVEKERVIAEKEAELQQKEAESAEVIAKLEANRQEERKAMAEIQILEQDAAFEKERELKVKQEQKNSLLAEIQKTEERLTYWKNRHTEIDERMKANTEKRNKHEEKQKDLLSDLEGLARDAEFRYHDVFHGRFTREIPQDEFMFESWKKGIDEHERSLKTALECAREHQQAKKRVQEREVDLGIATQRRDQAEAFVQESESLLEARKEEQQARLFAWRKQARILKLEEAEMTRVLHLLTLFPEVAYGEVKEAATERYQPLLQSIWQQRAHAEAEKKRLLDEERRKAAELQAWKHQREPEPPRSLCREETRATYAKRQVVGVPLYAACEFQPHVPEEKRAVLEAVLQETGLLDAWIGIEGLQWTREDEEFWVQPAPLDFGYTLADYLKPTPPEDGSVTAEQIDLILRSVEIGDPLSASERVVLSEDGQFRMGTLIGKVRPKSRAEYIGRESRRQTRLAAITRIEQEIADIRLLIQQQEEWLQHLQEQELALRADVAAFPSGADLNTAQNQVLTVKEKWKMVAEELERKNQLFKESVQEENSVRQRLRDLTQDWVALKDEQLLTMAVEQFRIYRDDFFELRSHWNQYMQLQKAVSDDKEELQNARDRVENEQEHLEEYRDQLRETEAVIQAYENALKAMGVAEKYAQLKGLRERVAQLEGQRKALSRQKESLAVDVQVLTRELADQRKSLQEVVSHLYDCLAAWRHEWNLKLVAKWREQTLGEERDEQVRMCREVFQGYRGSFEARKTESILNSLVGVVIEVRSHLHDYVLEMIADESGRQLVRFNYDRMNPITPERLLHDLEVRLIEQNLLLSEKEQELLEKVLIQSVGVSIREKIQRAEEWVKQMNALMKQRHTSSGLQLQLKWEPKPKLSEAEMDTTELVELLRIDYEHLTEEKREQIHRHFQEKINGAKEAAEEQHMLKDVIQKFLDYRDWYRFKLSYKKGEQVEYRELTDSRFNVLSGGEKAMAMYIPLFAAVSSRYKGSSPESPKLVSLDEAFAGVDEENVRDMFDLLTQMEFDYMMTSQVLWGCYDTVPGLSIYEIVRPKDANYVDVIPYVWNGKKRIANFEALGQNLAV